MIVTNCIKTTIITVSKSVLTVSDIVEVLLRYYVSLNGSSYLSFPEYVYITGDFTHTLTGTFSNGGFYLLSNNETDNTNRTLVGYTGNFYSGISTKVMSVNNFDDLTDGFVHTFSYGRVDGVWWCSVDGVSDYTYYKSDSKTIWFNNFGDQYGSTTGVPLYVGYTYNHTITGITESYYPSGEIILPLSEAFGEDYIDTSNGSTITIINAVEDDYTTIDPDSFPLDDIVLNGGFDTDASYWELQGSSVSAVVDDGYISVQSSSYEGIYQDIVTTIGVTYGIKIHNTSRVSSCMVRLYDGDFTGDMVEYTVDDNYSFFEFTASTTSTRIYLRNGSSGTTVWDYVMVSRLV